MEISKYKILAALVRSFFDAFSSGIIDNSDVAAEERRLTKTSSILCRVTAKPTHQRATKQTIDENGWYHTGDLGTMDGDGNVFIKGRSKNMLLGASGQNIYPEEIEDKLNSLALVAESVVVQKGDKLIALVHPDYDEAQTLNLGNNELADIMEQNRQELNSMIPAYSKVSEIRIHEEEFEKTPKKSIKRFLYTIND